MSVFLYKFFHRKSNDRTEGGLINVPQDSSLWPASWKQIEYKNYLFHTPVPLFDHSQSPLFKSLMFRTSNEKKLLENSINLSKLSCVLKIGYGTTYFDNFFHRTAPSGGARYPLEIYLFLFQDIEGLRSGIYHYNVIDHSLEPIKFKSFPQKEIARFQAYQWASSAHGMFCITSVFNRTTRKYGSRGYRYILLEAGHVVQNMLLAAIESGITLRPMESTLEAVVEEEIGISESIEGLIYSVYF